MNATSTLEQQGLCWRDCHMHELQCEAFHKERGAKTFGMSEFRRIKVMWAVADHNTFWERIQNTCVTGSGLLLCMSSSTCTSLITSIGIRRQP
jgi:hypothetical protein